MEGASTVHEEDTTFRDRFAAVFDAHHPRLFRFLDRLTGDPDLAADLAQEAFVRLHQRNALPDHPEAWLVSVGLNLLRNAESKRRRRLGLLSATRGARAHSDPPARPDEAAVAEETRRRARAALDTLSEREQRLLLLQAEGYGYREIAQALGLKSTSVGTLLARAKRAFLEASGEGTDAP